MSRHWIFAEPYKDGFLVVLLLVTASVTHSQSSNLPSCYPAELDTTFLLINGPGDKFTAAFNMRNVSGHACHLDRVSYGATGSPTVPDRTDPWGKVFVLTHESTVRVWGEAWVPAEPGPILASDKLAHMSIVWNARPLRESDPCIQPIAINWPVRIVAPLLMRQLCSEIEVSGFDLGTFRPSAASRKETRRTDALLLTIDQNNHYDGVNVLLHVSFPKSEARKSPEDRLSRLYVQERYPDGAMDFRSAFRLPQNGCPPLIGDTHLGRIGSPHTTPKVKKDGFNLDPDGCGSVISGKREGEHVFQVFQSVASPTEGTVRLLHSNVVRIRFTDAQAGAISK